MACETDVTLAFADGHYRFWLPLPQVRELERDGPVLLALAWHLQGGIGIDETGKPFYAGGTGAEIRAIRDVIRLGLIGGNRAIVDGEELEVGPKRAAELLDAYVFPTRALSEAAAIAWRVLAAAVYGNDPQRHTLASTSDPTPPIAETEESADG